MFEITEEPFGKFKQYFLINYSTQEYVAIIPEFGASINQLVLKKNHQLHHLIDGYENYEQLEKEGSTKFKGCKLFPFPNRIKNGKYSFEGNEYQFPINFPSENNAIHGLVYDAAFTIINQETNNNFAKLTIEHITDGNNKVYPFKVSCRITFQLDEKGFTCSTSIQNLDSKNIPVGDGWHPYFKTGSKMDDCYLKLPIEYSFEVDNKMIPTGKQIFEHKFKELTKIENTNFDTGFKIKGDNQKAEVLIEDKQKNIIIKYWQECGIGKYDYLQVYIPPHRNSIAIEPMSCNTNAFNNNEGLLILKPKEDKEFCFGVNL